MSSSASAPPSRGGNSNRNSKKRRRDEQRERLQRYGVEVPDIPGLPVPLIPVHVHTLQVTTKFFQSVASDQVIDPYTAGVNQQRSSRPEGATDEPFNNGDIDEVNGGQQQHQRQQQPRSETVASGEGSVMQSIFRRLDASQSNALERSDEQRELRERCKVKDDAMTSWLQAVHRHLRDVQHHPNSQTPPRAVSKTTSTPSVAVCALKHLWELQQEHHSMSGRRACLHLSAQILLKSAECRQWLLDPGSTSSTSLSTSSSLPLVAWMDRIGHIVAKSTKDAPQSVQREEEHAARCVCWQREAFQLLQGLIERGYGSLYPTLTAAVLRFRQQQQATPHLSSPWPRFHPQTVGAVAPPEGVAAVGEAPLSLSLSSQNDNAPPTTLRHCRDQAMMHCQQEAKRVHQLLQQAHQWMEVLVPRMGDSSEIATAIATSGGALVVDHDDGEREEEELDVDWEDGWDDDSPGRVDESDDKARHAAAVEQTLATMAASGGLREGELTVELGVACDDDHCPTTNIATTLPDPAKAAALQQLTQLVERLSTRHLPRLTAWTNGLTKADNLVPSKAGGITLVALPLSRSQVRKETLDTVVRLKTSVASVLSSARRLGVVGSSDVPAPPTPTNRAIPPVRQQYRTRVVGLGGGGTTTTTTTLRHVSLASTLDKRPGVRSMDATHLRSNRIQIKYRKI